MIFAIPDAIICGPVAGGNVQAGCDPARFSTSHRNTIHDNRMGISPDGRALPNGLDFWWDEFVGNRANCWYGNHGPKPITSSPGQLPHCDSGADPSSSVGLGNVVNYGELISCLLAFETRNFDPNGTCPWLRPPQRPGTAAAAAERRRYDPYYRQTLIDFCEDLKPEPTCGPFESLLPAR